MLCFPTLVSKRAFTMSQRILQRLRPIRAKHDPIIRMETSALPPIASQAPNVPLVQIASQISDLLLHEPYYRTWTLSLFSTGRFPNRHVEKVSGTVLQQIIPLVFTTLAVGRFVAIIAPLSILSFSFFCQSPG